MILERAEARPTSIEAKVARSSHFKEWWESNTKLFPLFSQIDEADLEFPYKLFGIFLWQGKTLASASAKTLLELLFTLLAILLIRQPFFTRSHETRLKITVIMT